MAYTLKAKMRLPTFVKDNIKRPVYPRIYGYRFSQAHVKKYLDKTNEAIVDIQYKKVKK